MENGIKRFLSLALVLVMVIGMLPVTGVFAVGESTDPIQTVNNYDELASAITAGGMVRLGADIESSGYITIPEGVNAVLDLNGKTVSGSSIFKNYGNLTITDTSDIPGLVTANFSAVYNYGQLTVENGNFTGKNDPVILSYDSSTTVINGGIFSCNVEVIRAAGMLSVTDAVITGADAILIEGNSVATISGGSFTSNTSDGNRGVIRMEGSSQLTVTGGTFSGTAIFAVYAKGSGNLKIAGGVFETTNNFCANYNHIPMEITGGRFAANLWNGAEDYLPAGYTFDAEGYVIKAPVMTYDELKAALAAGGEYCLGADIFCGTNCALTVPAGIETVLDLKGYTLSFEVNDSIDNYGTLTVQDTSADSAGKLVASKELFHNKAGGKLTVDSVNIVGDDAGTLFVCEAGSETAITGGSVAGTVTGFASRGNLVLEGVMITCGHPVKAYSGNVTVKNDAELVSGGSQVMEIYGDANVTVEGGAFRYSGNNGYVIFQDGATGSLNIKAGSFESQVEYRPMFNGVGNMTVRITGGWFHVNLREEVKGYLSNSYLLNADGYVVKNNNVAMIGMTSYDDLSEALKAAEAGQTVKLMADVETVWVSVYEGITLDLNGNTLYAEYVTAVGDIIDSSEDNGGLLTVAADRIMLGEDNAQLPVRDENGYRFFELSPFYYGEKEEDNAKQYYFLPVFEAAANALLLERGEDSGVAIGVRVTWDVDNGTRTQSFVYSESLVEQVLGSYNQESGSYGSMYTLRMKNIQNFENLRYTAYVSSVSGVEQLPKDAQSGDTAVSGSQNVTSENNQVAEDVTIQAEEISAQVPQGTKLEENTTQLTLTVAEVSESESNITLGENESQKSVDVHIEGVAADNTVPMLITLPAFAEKGLNAGNLKLYHVESGETVAMTQEASVDALDAHNEFYYDPATGDVTLSLATFSEIAVVSDTEKKWEGSIDTSWYNTEDTSFEIANADQLAGFGAIVGGMAEGIKQDSFEGKTVKLISDINLGDDEKNNNDEVIFYPIGYNSDDGTYEKTKVAVTTGFYSFEGTFDGNGHTIANFYQNTWEMKGDNNYYDATLQYYRDGMGLFGKVYGGTVKNLTVKNFSSDGEYTTTGVIAAYADGATFENIAIFDCNPRVYNIGNGGIVGCVGWYAKAANLKTTFTNITVDNSNKISALWGSYDVACGGLVGQYYPISGQSSANYPVNAGIHMENCHVSAQIDVYNDVCGNYQYYAYRYAGMLIGSIRENETIDGYVYPKMDGITASGCTVHFGDWNDYYYCELVANSIASYTHDHQFSRLEQVESVDVEKKTVTSLKGEETAIPTSGRVNYVVVNGDHATENATCYHFVDGEQWTHDKAGTEEVDVNGDGVKETVQVEDKQHIYLEFNNLFTGYGWGVTSKGLTDYEGVENMDITQGDHEESVEKFKQAENAQLSYTTDDTVTIGELFAAIEGAGVEIKAENVQVTVSPVGDDSTAGGTYVPYTEVDGATDWTQGTLSFSGTGAATITIQDYYFCEPTTINVTITEKQKVEKFDIVMNNGDFLHRVGNSGTVALDKLFKAKDGVTVGTVSVTVEAVNGTGASGTYSNNAIQFNGTGVVKVTITDNDACIPAELYLEVVDAKNITKAESATNNNVVLLNDISGTFTVSNGHTFYGNGFTVTLPTTSVQNVGNGFTGYISVGASQDDGVANGGNLDNVRIEGPVYPEMYIYRDQAKITSTSDPDYGDGYNMRYFKNSVIVYGGNVTISNCYISGARTALCLRGGNNVVIENTTLSGGAYANMQICAGSSVTLRDLTTVQVDVTDSYGKDKTAHGLGIAVDSAVVDICIEGELKQYNWLNKTTWDKQVPANYQSSFPDFFGNDKYSKYWHYLNGGTDPYVSLAFVFACNWDTSKIHDERKTVDYEICDSTIAGVAGGVYSKVNTVGGNAIAGSDLADPGYTSPGFNPVAPVLDFDNSPNADADDANDASDTYCVYNESDGTLKIGVTGDSKLLDLSKVSVSKNGAALAHTVYLNGTQVKGDSVTIKAADGAKQTLTFKASSNDAGYDKNGNPISGSIEYTWTVTVEIAVLSFPAPVWNMGGNYQFNETDLHYAYYKTSQGYGEAVPIYEDIKVTYYNKEGTKVELDLSGTTTHPTGSNNSNSNAFTYTLADGATLTMKFSSGWKSGATTHQFTTYDNKVYIYPQSLDNDNYVRAKTTNQDFDVKITYNFTDPNGQSTGDQTMRWYNAKASNGNVSTVQWKTFDSTNGKDDSCIIEGTLITMADGTQKPVEEVNVGDMVLAFNHISGSFEATPVIFNTHMDEAEAATYEVLYLKFSNGLELGVVASHGLFDVSLMQYVYLDYDNYQDYIGHEFYYAGNDGALNEHVALEDAYITTENVRVFCPVTYFHMNSIANGFLGTPSIPGDITGLVNYFEYDPDLKYNEEAMQQDIETYGLYTYDDFKAYISEEAYNSSPSVYLKVAVGKGMITFEEILDVIYYLLAGSLIQ